MTMGQIRGMYNGDRSRKEMLVNYGFRLPSALTTARCAGRSLRAMFTRLFYVSATPGDYEMNRRILLLSRLSGRQGFWIQRWKSVQPWGQIDDLLGEINARVEKNERTFITTLTKKMAEDLTDYFKEIVKAKVIYALGHQDLWRRTEIIRDLRLGVFDVLVGINLCARELTFRRLVWWQF